MNTLISAGTFRVLIWCSFGGLIAIATMAFFRQDSLYLVPFREAQTALSAEYMREKPNTSMMEYETPVFGPPWSIPLEYPLFQKVTSWLASGTGVPIPMVGRVLSFAGFVTCIFLVYLICRAIGAPREAAIITICMLVSAPVYSVYSTAHMMESWALLAALIYIYSTVKWIAGGPSVWFGVALAFGIVAALIKITSWLPATVMVIGVTAIRTTPLQKRAQSRLKVAVVVILSFAAGCMWSAWCSYVRAQNPMHDAILNDARMREWVFGTIQDRHEVSGWILLGVKQFTLIFGVLGVPIVAGIVVVALLSKKEERYLALITCVCLVAYFVHALTFFRLNQRHDYYVFGSGVYLVIACGVTMEAASRRFQRFRTKSICLAIIASCLLVAVPYLMLKLRYRDPSMDDARDVVNCIKQEGAIVTLGLDWSSKLPLETHRRALMIIDDPAATGAIAATLRTKPTNYAAVIILGRRYGDLGASIARQIGWAKTERLQFAPNGWVLTNADFGPVKWQGAPFSVSEDIEAKFGSVQRRPDGLIGIKLTRGPFLVPSLEILVRRKADAFWLSVFTLELVRYRGWFDRVPEKTVGGDNREGV